MLKKGGIKVALFENQQVPQANYDYNDLADGIGYVLYYGALTETDSGEEGILTRDTLISSKFESSREITTSSSWQNISVTFNTSQFNSPRTVKGEIKIVIPAKLWHTAERSSQMYMEVSVQKWDGSQETTLTTITSETITLSTGSSGGSKERCFVMKGTLPETSFKIGDVLRIEVTGWGLRTGGTGNNYIYIGFAHDPQNHATDNVWGGSSSAAPYQSMLEFHIPYKLEL